MLSMALHRSPLRPHRDARAVEGRAGRRARVRGRSLGFTIVEILIALSVLVVAASIFYQMVIGATRLRQVNHENALAADAARVVLERMRNETFLEVYRLYNEDPQDDPAGQGTAPGNTFDVAGLTALDGGVGGKPGSITFPSLLVQSGGGGGGKKKMGMMGGGGEAVSDWQLREDYEDDSLGLPRDLNGDNVIDSADHSSDYILLPVRVRVSWKGPVGPRSFQIVTMLGEFDTEP
jgi:prepilin-type N-terminal cleavage/methylation domain-containing protein